MSVYRVEKIKMRATILTEAGRIGGSFFVNAYSSLMRPIERVMNMLEEPDSLIPFEQRNGVVELIAKDAISVAWIEEDDVAGDVVPTLTVFAAFEWSGQRTFQGQLEYSRPTDSARLLDFLNAAKGFFMGASQGRPVILNRTGLVRCRELTEQPASSAPRPAATPLERRAPAPKAKPAKAKAPKVKAVKGKAVKAKAVKGKAVKAKAVKGKKTRK